MAEKGNAKKEAQLGMSRGKANNILRRSILFRLVQMCELDVCYQCEKKIETVEELSVEHKVPWLDSDNPTGLYFDLDNIAFSHRSCNYRAARKDRGISYTSLVCAGCGTTFQRETWQVTKAKTRNQKAFYCTTRCAGNEKK
jgi:hypothetical protein